MAGDSSDCRCELQDGIPQGLTCIHWPIHCVATQDLGEDRLSDLDLVIIDNFNSTLAEVALAVATRRSTQDEQVEPD